MFTHVAIHYPKPAHYHDLHASMRRLDAAAQGTPGLIQIGDRESDVIADQYRLAARLCILVGADETLIAEWRETGRKRAADASHIPYTGGDSL